MPKLKRGKGTSQISQFRRRKRKNMGERVAPKLRLLSKKTTARIHVETENDESYSDECDPRSSDLDTDTNSNTDTHESSSDHYETSFAIVCTI